MADMDNDDVVRDSASARRRARHAQLGWRQRLDHGDPDHDQRRRRTVQLDGTSPATAPSSCRRAAAATTPILRVAFVNYLPSLAEGVSVNTASINGVADQSFLFGDGSVRFTLDLKSAVSAFANSARLLQGRSRRLDQRRPHPVRQHARRRGEPALRRSRRAGQRRAHRLLPDPGRLPQFRPPARTISPSWRRDGPARPRRQRARDPEERQPGRTRPAPRSSIPPPRSIRTAPTRSCPASSRAGRNCRSASRTCRTPPATGIFRTS